LTPEKLPVEPYWTEVSIHSDSPWILNAANLLEVDSLSPGAFLDYV
jgi:hypothetical protein